jgi:hypothetical protein
MGGSGRAAVPTWGGDVGVDRLCSYGYKRIAAGTRKRFDLHKRHSFTRYTDMARVGLATASMLTHTASFYRCGERCRGGWLCKLLVFLGLRRGRTQLHCGLAWLSPSPSPSPSAPSARHASFAGNVRGNVGRRCIACTVQFYQQAVQ